MTNSGEPPAASAKSTGGAGTHFEQHVDAMFLAMLLVQGFAPLFEQSQVRQVCMQTRDLGWHTDDLLVVANRDEGPPRKLAAQIKLGLTISENDEECRKTFSAFWSDFNNTELFDRGQDRLALFVQQGTKTLLGSFGALLELAHSASDASDFQRRLKKGAASPARYAGIIRSIIAADRKPSDDEFLDFLRCLSLDSYDLGTLTARTEAFVKTLLAFTSNQADPIENARTTWTRLLEIASEEKPRAACFTYKDLPDDLRLRHGRVSSADEVSFNRLIAHSEQTLDLIPDSIGHSIRVHRDPLVAQVNDLMDENQVVVIVAAAGFGKSALAKSVIQSLSRDTVCLAFRAEEFATSHIDQTLHQAHVDLTFDRLTALLAAHGRKVILIESIERLLEAEVRDGLKSLLAAVRKDPGIRVIITCRDYSWATVEASLISPAGLLGKFVPVPGFTDSEQEIVVEKIPALRPLMAKPGLKSLLRSPYMLNMAARMDWDSEAAAFPDKEVAFRTKCWSEVVRNEAIAAQGLPRRREDVFMTVALRRAKALRPFVPCDDLDATVLHALQKDGLIVFAVETQALAAPSHDVLEDWAIIRWLDERFAVHEHSAEIFSRDLSGHPAIRRTFRKWLGELLARDPDLAGKFVVGTLQSDQIPAYVRDDALTATLLSDSVADFLKGQSTHLLASDSRLLARTIHLLRVAAKAPPDWALGSRALSQLLIPVGSAWPAVLDFAKNNFVGIPSHLYALLIGLIEDWALLVSWKDPEPAGFASAGAIAFYMLDRMQEYDAEELGKRLLTVITKTPTAVPDRFLDLIDRGSKREQDPVAQDFVNIILPGLDANLACRAYPDAMIRLTKANLLMTEADLSRREHYDPIDIDHFFGMRRSYSHDFFPASAARGPFAPLLLTHPTEAVQLILDLANHAGKWYVERGSGGDRLEPAFSVSVQLPGDSVVEQWANGRLWQLYRGSSVGPESLKCALMALEQWLLAISRRDQVDLDSWLLFLLRGSNNVAVTAVLASACIAHPEKATETGLALLSSRELIWLDRQRMATERMSSSLIGLMPGTKPEHAIYEGERKAANPLPHRQHDIEFMAVRLQFTKVRDDVWRVIDKYRDALPPLGSQNEDDRVWRLALHRIDVRGFQEVQQNVPTGSAGNTDEGTDVIYYAPGNIEDDVKEVVDRASSDMAKMNRDLSLLNWGLAAWQRKGDSTEQAQNWRGMLAAAQARLNSSEPTETYAEGGPGLIAAVCVRDHLTKLDENDQRFCIDLLVQEIERDADTEDTTLTRAHGISSSNRCAAFAITSALAEDDPASPSEKLVSALATALTHAVPEVQEYAVAGIGRNLVGKWRPFALRCAVGLAIKARVLEALPRDEANWYELRHQKLTAVNEEVRDLIRANSSYDVAELGQIDMSSWNGQAAASAIHRIFADWFDADVAVKFHKRIVEFLAETWKRKPGSHRGEQRNYQFEYSITEAVAGFVLKLKPKEALSLCSGFTPLVAEDSEDLARFIHDLIYAEDRQSGITPFWDIWHSFKTSLLSTPRLAESARRRRFGSSVIRAMFLGVQWKDGVRDWDRLSGHAGDIESLAKELPPSSTVFGAYCRFVYSIGGASLPDAFVVVANLLKPSDPSTLLHDEYSVFYLEAVLGRFTYSEPLRLKSEPTTREAVLQILNDLVDAGSSAAFRMRDDFVTPASGELSIA